MVTRRSTQETIPSVERPPLNEVACDLKFDPLPEFKVPYIGLFWERISEAFPRIEHQQPIGWPKAGQDILVPFPRIWFLDSKRQTFIQIQEDRFSYNWRKTGDSESYPRFSKILPIFQENFDLFCYFINEKGLGKVEPNTCELIYTNHIPMGDVWNSFSEIKRILPDIAWRQGRGRFLKHIQNVFWQASFSLPDDHGTLFVRAQSAMRKIDKRPMLVLEFRASGLGADKSVDAVWQWFHMAHEWIVRGFFDLTGPKIQDFWGPQDD